MFFFLSFVCFVSHMSRVENTLVFCFIFLVKIGIPLHLFDLGLEISSGCGKHGLINPLVS